MGMWLLACLICLLGAMSLGTDQHHYTNTMNP